MSQSSNANRIQKGILAIDKQMFDFIENEVLPKVGVDSDSYWSGFEKVIKTVCYLSDIADFAAFNEVYAKYFVSKPARSCFAVKDLPKGALCEIEVIAEV